MRLRPYSHMKYILAAAAVLIAGGLFWSVRPLQEFFYGSVEVLATQSGWERAMLAGVFVLLAALSSFLSLVSSVPLVPAAVLVFGERLTFLLLLFGWVIGGVIAYVIGRYPGYFAVRRLAIFQRAETWRRHLSNRTETAIAFLLLLGLPSETSYVFGLARYSFKRYLLMVLFAELPFALVTVYASSALVSENRLRFLAWVAGGFAFAGGMTYLLYRQLKKRKDGKKEEG
jgi:uncharacterized membrane protein YdjX (TVP38/TMEM64 family)